MVTMTAANIFPFPDETVHRGFEFSVQSHTAGFWAQEFWLHCPALNHEPEEGVMGEGHQGSPRPAWHSPLPCLLEAPGVR